MLDMVIELLVVAQVVALAVLGMRLWPGRMRRPPVAPRRDGLVDTSVSVIVATLNEAHRIGPCLAGLRAQGRELLEILVVDSRSSDDTRDVVAAAAALDPRIRLLADDVLAVGWVGKVWALEHGLRAARGEWILGIDADTEPMPGMVAGAVAAARANGFSVASFSPKFAGQSRLEQLVQPALLRTLVYRCGAAGADGKSHRMLANGQCFLALRDVLIRHGGYAPARASFADDVTLARHLASRGERVGFLDGSRLYLVRSYQSATEMWREWGRSLDLRSATTVGQQWSDIALLVGVQALPLPVLVALACAATFSTLSSAARMLIMVNAALLSVHLLMLRPLSRSYQRPRLAFWLSWLADPLAVVRIVMSTVQRKRTWRGRRYKLASS